MARKVRPTKTERPAADEVVWSPHPGPQTAALRAGEFDVFYGGAKGGGKSDWIVVVPLRQVVKPAYKALILRETYGELEELIRRSHAIYSQMPEKPTWRGSPLQQWQFPNPDRRSGAGGAIVKFGYCKRMDDVQRYQGQEWAHIGFDEFANVADHRIRDELLKEIRCPDPSVHRSFHATGNPGYAGHGHVKRTYIEPCGRGGERVHWFTQELPNGMKLERSRRFIPASVFDNPVYANDPQYLATLYALPEARRQQLLEGDWDVGVGLAFPELSFTAHLVEAFAPPGHWQVVAGLDWGFSHLWVCVAAAIDEDGSIFIIDTVKGWREFPDKIADKVKRLLPASRIQSVHAGRDCWSKIKAYGDSTPSVAEKLIESGLPLVQANINRIHGLNQMRDYISYKGRESGGGDSIPALRFMDTANNRWLMRQLENMILDPNDREDVLKIDVDQETGQGGDDGYDALRYLVSSRPPRARSQWGDKTVSAWDPTILRAEHDRGYRVTDSRPRKTEADPWMAEW